MSAAAGHFTAVLQVEEVRVTAAEPARYANQPGIPASRDVVEVAKVVIRADTLDELKEKLAKHAALV